MFWNIEVKLPPTHKFTLPLVQIPIDNHHEFVPASLAENVANENLYKALYTSAGIKILQLFCYCIQEGRAQCPVNDAVVVT